MDPKIIFDLWFRIRIRNADQDSGEKNWWGGGGVQRDIADKCNFIKISKNIKNESRIQLMVLYVQKSESSFVKLEPETHLDPHCKKQLDPDSQTMKSLQVKKQKYFCVHFAKLREHNL